MFIEELLIVHIVTGESRKLLQELLVVIDGIIFLNFFAFILVIFLQTLLLSLFFLLIKLVPPSIHHAFEVFAEVIVADIEKHLSRARWIKVFVLELFYHNCLHDLF